VTLSMRGRYRQFELDWLTGLYCQPIIRSYYLGKIAWQKVIVGLSSYLAAVSVNAFMFAVYQKITKIEVFDSNQCGSVVDDILEPLFTRSESFFRLSSIAVFPS
jgi:hypothetical protein